VTPPPQHLIRWTLATLRARIAKGDYPPDGWIEWLEEMDKALTESETTAIEIIATTDIDRFLEMKA
jgi:hypothetical protein